MITKRRDPALLLLSFMLPLSLVVFTVLLSQQSYSWEVFVSLALYVTFIVAFLFKRKPSSV
jgi:hypothetical protein